MFRASGFTQKGGARPANEDSFAIDEELQLCVVADGLSGHRAGEIASRLAVETILDCVRGRRADQDLSPEERWVYGFDPAASFGGNLLRTAMQFANAAILETALWDDRCAGMGTTVIAALVVGQRLSVAHVGDSRLYLAVGERCEQLTRDDSWVMSIADGTGTPASALQCHPLRGALTRAVGRRSGADVHVVEAALSGGELLLLSTDGVHDTLDLRQIGRLLTGAPSPSAAAEGLVQAARAQGSEDDCTVVVGRYGREPMQREMRGWRVRPSGRAS